MAVGHAFQHVLEADERFDVVELGGGDEGTDGGLTRKVTDENRPRSQSDETSVREVDACDAYNPFPCSAENFPCSGKNVPCSGAQGILL
jgi:hypothetical protein